MKFLLIISIIIIIIIIVTLTVVGSFFLTKSCLKDCRKKNDLPSLKHAQQVIERVIKEKRKRQVRVIVYAAGMGSRCCSNDRLLEVVSRLDPSHAEEYILINASTVNPSLFSHFRYGLCSYGNQIEKLITNELSILPKDIPIKLYALGTSLGGLALRLAFASCGDRLLKKYPQLQLVKFLSLDSPQCGLEDHYWFIKFIILLATGRLGQELLGMDPHKILRNLPWLDEIGFQNTVFIARSRGDWLISLTSKLPCKRNILMDSSRKCISHPLPKADIVILDEQRTGWPWHFGTHALSFTDSQIDCIVSRLIS